jgi:8-oxo-dGTP pyrophosphatase MutT (NUDIX family)
MHGSIPIVSPGINCAVFRQSHGGWQTLLLKRSPTSLYGGAWGLLSGTSARGETAEQTAMRELHEETSLVAESLWVTEYAVQFYEPSANEFWILPVFAAIVSPDSELKLCAENSEYLWGSLVEAQQTATWNNIKETLGQLFIDLHHFPPQNWKQVTP